MSKGVQAVRDWFNPVRSPEDEARHAWVEEMASLCILRSMLKDSRAPVPKELQTRKRKR